MQGDGKVVDALARFEAVEWVYDGLNGKIIPWTKENGNESDDPSILAFVVTPDERVFSRCPVRDAYSASTFAKWLREQADAYEKEHPRTLVPLVRAVVSGAEGARRCAALDEAVAAGTPTLLYFGRDSRRDDDREAKAAVKAAREFEKKHFGSKSNAAAAEGWALLRLDLADAEHAAFAATLGVTGAPAVLVYVPGQEKPADLTKKLRSGSLAYQLKKLRPDDD